MDMGRFYFLHQYAIPIVKVPIEKLAFGIFIVWMCFKERKKKSTGAEVKDHYGDGSTGQL